MIQLKANNPEARLSDQAGGLMRDCPGLDLSCGPEEVRCGGAVARLELGPNGLYGLSHSEDGRSVRLVSAVNPEAEDLALLDRAGLDYGRGVICFGLGLGYYLEELALRLEPGRPIWVLESRPELAACALSRPEVSALLKRPEFKLFVGPFQQAPWPGATPPFQVLWRPATARHFAGEYPNLAGPAAPPALKARRIKRLLLFQGGYFLDRELQNAAAELGLQTAAWTFQRRLEGDGREFAELLKLIKTFRPEMVLTVNHLGFDAEGVMEDAFTRLNLPAASWFVDSPFFILKNHRPGPLARAFSWDGDYLAGLKGMGFKEVHYLPLAADQTFFQPAAASERPERKTAFVGDSLSAATDKFLGRLGFGPGREVPAAFLPDLDRAAAEFLEGPELLPDKPRLEQLTSTHGLAFSPDQLADLAALLTWRASRLKRLRVLAAFPPEGLTVAGDRAWGGLLNPPPASCLPPLDYYSGLASFYRSSQVNLNITSAQMKSGLNQRVFDVPACGAFLLSDDQRQLAELFEPGREAVVYRSPEEAARLAGWYAGNERARLRIAAAARRRVLAGHLYRHRLEKMLELMRDDL